MVRLFGLGKKEIREKKKGKIKKREVKKREVKRKIKPKIVKMAKKKKVIKKEKPIKKVYKKEVKKIKKPKKVIKREKKIIVPSMISEEEIKYDSKKLPFISMKESKQRRDFKPKIDLKKCEKTYNCFLFCPTGAIKISNIGNPEIDYDLCDGCLICLRECPTGAITEEREK
jgi:2-oxoacid:acceptor oxidoreductase delta subunit (pyruvate/2-ketoisovalerate family)